MTKEEIREKFERYLVQLLFFEATTQTLLSSFSDEDIKAFRAIAHENEKFKDTIHKINNKIKSL